MTTKSDPSRCALGIRGCYRARGAAYWRVEWRVGFGHPAALCLAGRYSECEVLAQTPSPALPGSYKRLVEVLGASERTWLSADAADLAVARVAMLKRLRRPLAQPWDLGLLPKHWRAVSDPLLSTSHVAGRDAVLDAMHALTQALEAAHQEPLLSMSSQQACHAQLEVLQRAVLADAVALAVQWFGHEASLGHAFAEVAQAFVPVRPRRVRRYVQMHEHFVPVVAPRSGLSVLSGESR